jgi:hypothetical protein
MGTDSHTISPMLVTGSSSISLYTHVSLREHSHHHMQVCPCGSVTTGPVGAFQAQATQQSHYSLLSLVVAVVSSMSLRERCVSSKEHVSLLRERYLTSRFKGVRAGAFPYKQP